MQSTSINLLKRLREPRAELAWQRFVELYAPLIFKWASQKGLNSTDSADLTQDVLATLVVKLPQFEYDPSQRFRAWLRTITVNRATDILRRNARYSGGTADEILDCLALEDRWDLFEQINYRAEIVQRTLSLLQADMNERTWCAGYLQLVDGKPATAVAEQLKMSLNAVYLAKSRLLARLREELLGLLD